MVSKAGIMPLIWEIKGLLSTCLVFYFIDSENWILKSTARSLNSKCEEQEQILKTSFSLHSNDSISKTRVGAFVWVGWESGWVNEIDPWTSLFYGIPNELNEKADFQRTLTKNFKMGNIIWMDAPIILSTATLKIPNLERKLSFEREKMSGDDYPLNRPQYMTDIYSFLYLSTSDRWDARLTFTGFELRTRGIKTDVANHFCHIHLQPKTTATVIVVIILIAFVVVVVVVVRITDVISTTPRRPVQSRSICNQFILLLFT